MRQLKIALYTLGGTIDKDYCEASASLKVGQPAVHEIVSTLRLPGVELQVIPLLSKDSLEMTASDRESLLFALKRALPAVDGVVITHGTDTLAVTGEFLLAQLPALEKTIVLTGAMTPSALKRSDATQNLTEALLAVKLLSSGIYCVFHGQVLPFPGVTKDYTLMTFTKPAA